MFLDRIDEEAVPHSSGDVFIPRNELCVGYLIKKHGRSDKKCNNLMHEEPVITECGNSNRKR